MSGELYGIFQWCGEPGYNIYKLERISQPRKDVREYEVGEIVEARWRDGRVYSAKLELIGGEYFTTFILSYCVNNNRRGLQ